MNNNNYHFWLLCPVTPLYNLNSMDTSELKSETVPVLPALESFCLQLNSSIDRYVNRQWLVLMGKLKLDMGYKNMLSQKKSRQEHDPERIEHIAGKYKTYNKSCLRYGDIVFLKTVINSGMDKGVVLSRQQESVNIYGGSLNHSQNY